MRLAEIRGTRLRDFYVRTALQALKGRGETRALFGLLFASSAVFALGIAVPWLTVIIFDRLVPAGSGIGLASLLPLMLVVVASSQLFELSAAFFRLRLQARFTHARRALIMSRILALPLRFLRDFRIGDLLTRAGLSDNEQERLLGSVFSGLFSGLFSTSSLAVLIRVDRRIGLISLAGGAFVLAVAAWVGQMKLKADRQFLRNSMGLRSFLLQVFMGISQVRISGAQARVYLKWREDFRRKQYVGLAAASLGNRSAAVFSAVPIACNGLFFLILAGIGGAGIGAGVGTVAGQSPGSSPGNYLALVSSFSLFMNGILGLASAISEFFYALPLFERCEPLLSALPESGPSGGTRAGTLSGRLELRNISFRYAPEGPLVLEDVCLAVAPGQFIALVGASGSGKSTVVRLLLGFERPTSGEILYDGIPLAELDILEVRRQLGTVLQDDHLMPGNIYENISAVRPVTSNEAWEAARIAGLDEDLARLPLGMRSFVSPGGRAFSGGERQRIMLARAVAGAPRFLILDEATSALDNRVQDKVMRNLKELRVTRIVVAHRLSTIREADLILVLDRGRVVERGDFDTLISANGFFARAFSKLAP